MRCGSRIPKMMAVATLLAWGGCQSSSVPLDDGGAVDSGDDSGDDSGSRPDAEPPQQRWVPLAATGVEGVEVDQALLVQLADRYRAVGAEALTAEQRSALRGLNPAIVLTKYQASVSGTPSIENRHPEWIVRDSEGQPVHSLNSQSMVLLDPGNTELRATRVAQAVAAVQDEGFDGIMFDEAFIVASFYQGFAGINPRTGNVWQEDEFRLEQLANVRAIREALPDALIGCNSVGRGEKYFAHLDISRAFAGVCDALLAEGYRGSMSDPPDVFLSEREWLQNVDMGYDIAGQGSSLIAICEYDEALVDDAEVKARVDLFNYATFLVGYREGALFSATLEDRSRKQGGGYDNTTVFRDFQTIDPGAPLSDRYERLDGAYARRFEKMLVLVNPSDGPLSVTLDADHTSQDRTTFRAGDGVDLSAHGAMLLIP